MIKSNTQSIHRKPQMDFFFFSVIIAFSFPPLILAHHPFILIITKYFIINPINYFIRFLDFVITIIVHFIVLVALVDLIVRLLFIDF